MPRFCPNCGESIGLRAPVVCPRCGHEQWLKASRAGAALVVHEGRLLLTRRAHEPWLGMWCAPSGFSDGPEHPAATAERDTLEEVGLRVRVIGYLGHWVDEYLPGREDGVEPQYCAVSYYHAVPAGAIEIRADPAEVGETRWSRPDELPDALAPPVNGHRIYGAWLEAFRSARLDSPLPDLP